MMKIIWGLVAVTLILLIGLALKWGIAPQAIKLIDPSEFTQPEEMGAAIYNRLRQNLENESVVIMGGSATIPTHALIAQGFLARAAQDGQPFQHVIFEPSALTLPPDIESLQLDLNDNLEKVAQLIQQIPAKHKLFIYTVNVYASHLLSGNPIQRLEAQLGGQRLFAISLATLAAKANEIDKVDPPCRGLAQDPNGTAELGCIAIARSRSAFRKHLNLNKYLLMMDQEGTQDYLALVRTP